MFFSHQARQKKQRSTIITRPVPILSLESRVESQTHSQCSLHSFFTNFFATSYLQLRRIDPAPILLRQLHTTIIKINKFQSKETWTEKTSLANNYYN